MPFQKYLTERNLYLLSGLVVVCWMIFDPHWEPVAVFVATCAVIKGISMAQRAKEKEEFTKEFNSYNSEIRNSLAYLVDTHLADQDRENQKEKMSKMWQEHGQGNNDVFIDYIIHSLMIHNSERCQFQVFNIVNTDGMIAAQLVQEIDRFLENAKKYHLEDYIKSTKLHDLYQWLVHPHYLEFRRKAYWPFYV
ncbi:hypothetical protein GCM10011403_24910 [Pseudohongiella nitratireducens]|uniref:Uncharacterized protein n=1 Tax=Pseudohongiella nitratireducens TaxID=1768907 RepID=A0A916QL78_9GAMM|nr:hypothetical protein [Pseudohongiella nitratireducens]GFZ80607.1 hypothetical protein GCM10011403_24910 [Pseudohongiella nitratireducens]